jgi:apolipoprotein N-acyltransferase
LAAGVLVALSLPPWGWWPLAVAGLGLLAWRLDGLSLPARLGAAVAFGLGQFVIGFWWMGEFTRPGSFLVMLLETFFVTVGLALVRRPELLPAGLVLAEAARDRVPLGGLPMAGVALGQTGGPALGSARLGGALLVLGLTACAGTGLAALLRRRWAPAGVLLAVAVGGVVASAVVPDGGRAVRTITIAAVQGGGPRGFRAINTDKSKVFERHLQATTLVRPPVDLVLWPEDVIDVDGPVDQTPEAQAVGNLAHVVGAPILGGVVEGSGTDHFRNAAVLWSSDGRIIGRYEKVHRVPFGEYVPARGLVSRLADLSAVPADAIPGTGSGAMDTPAGRVGITISYEVYFADRARAAVHDGGELLLVPTNAASFKTSQVPTTEVASARLRAVENGRDLVQAAPTGYAAFVDHRGGLLDRSTLGRQQVLQRPVALRQGRTIYNRTGDGPMVLLAALALAIGWAWMWRRRGRPLSPSS